MTIPMIVLALFSIIGGWIYSYFENALSYLPHIKFDEHSALNISLVSQILAIFGIMLAFFMYQKPIIPKSIGENFIIKGFYKILYARWGILSDWYELFILRSLKWFSGIIYRFFDLSIIDGIVRLFAYISALIGSGIRGLQDGKFSTYIVLIILIFTFILYLMILSG
jgi:NADH:ubiquinone oxidoreductase subunit 5 (subunit L)/multisubunit Na+/H+ antiporter MnhA subunit